MGESLMNVLDQNTILYPGDTVVIREDLEDTRYLESVNGVPNQSMLCTTNYMLSYAGETAVIRGVVYDWTDVELDNEKREYNLPLPRRYRLADLSGNMIDCVWCPTMFSSVDITTREGDEELPAPDEGSLFAMLIGGAS